MFTYITNRLQERNNSKYNNNAKAEYIRLFYLLKLVFRQPCHYICVVLLSKKDYEQLF